MYGAAPAHPRKNVRRISRKKPQKKGRFENRPQSDQELYKGDETTYRWLGGYRR